MNLYYIYDIKQVVKVYLDSMDKMYSIENPHIVYIRYYKCYDIHNNYIYRFGTINDFSKCCRPATQEEEDLWAILAL